MRRGARRRSALRPRRLDVVGGRLEVELHVRLDDADRLRRAGREGAALAAHLDHANVVLALVVQDAERLALGQRGEVTQRLKTPQADRAKQLGRIRLLRFRTRIFRQTVRSGVRAYTGKGLSRKLDELKQ
eukprot:6211133-Pleurochrysis_carterae.AAC.5